MSQGSATNYSNSMQHEPLVAIAHGGSRGESGATYADVAAGKEAILEFGREAARLGGCPLAEHGGGRNLVKQQLLLQMYGADGVDDMRAIKRVLDPAGILAPGVLFP